MGERKLVLLPINVPDNDFCWDGHTPCEYFDNYDYPKCDLKLGDPKEGVEICTYLKPDRCKNLKTK